MHSSERSSKSASPTKRTCSSPSLRARPSGWVSAKPVNAACPVRASSGAGEALEVDVEGGAVVELVDPVVRACGHEHRLADAAPAMTDADTDRRVGPDGRADDGVGEDLASVELVRGAHLQVVAGAATDQRDRRPGDRVGAPDDLLLIARQAVGEKHEDPVRAWLELVQRRSGLRARLAQAAGDAARHRGGHGEAGTADRGHDDPGIAGPTGGDLAGRRAADQRDRSGGAADGGEQRVQVVGIRAEDDEKARVSGRKRRGGGLGAGDLGVLLVGMADSDPTAGRREVPVTRVHIR
jgi:hypothetical protein